MSGESGLDPQRIALLIQAHRLLQKTDVAAEAFYGFFREGLPTQLPLLLVQSPAPSEKVFANWGWKLATDLTDAMKFMNGMNSYQHPVTTARIVALEKAGNDEFYIFYQRAVEGAPISNWHWKLATDTQDALDFVNGQGAHKYGVKGFEMGALWKSSHARFYVFANEGTHIWLQSPLENERFVHGKVVQLRALLTSEQATDGSALSWLSNVDGMLGQGTGVTVAQLSTSPHTITVTGYGVQATRPVRIFADLGDFYQAPSAPAEIARIDGTQNLLSSRFPKPPTHSNARVQAMIDELLGQ